MNRTAAHRQGAGFTLIELTCVLVIIGVLTAAAMPRFVVIGAEAHRGAVAATAGAFKGALHLAQTNCYIRGWANRDNLPGYGLGNVDFNTACFPTDTSGNANTIGSNNTRCLRVWNAIQAYAPTITTGVVGADYRARAVNNVCTYRYLADDAAARQFTYDSRNGLVVVTNP